MWLLIFGPPGAGKGTQATEIAERYGIKHISTGQFLAAAVREGTELGRKAASYVKTGELVPDDLVLALVEEVLLREAGNQGGILDGFPRTLPQAESLDELVIRQGWTLDCAIDLEVEDDELIRRITARRVCPRCDSIYHLTFHPPKVEGRCDECGAELFHREDDQEETLRTRLRVYREETAPVLEHYARKGLLQRVDGVGEPAEILDRICALLSEISPV